MEINNAYIEQILKRIFSQTENGKIQIGDEESAKWTYYVELLNEESQKENNGEISIKVRNHKKFIENLKQYLIIAKDFYEKDKFYFDINNESFHEKLILDLFINATNFDLNNIENYIEQRTEMLKDENLICPLIVVGKYLDTDILVEIRRNVSNLEGPYKFKIMLDNNYDSFHLPSVTFGKVGDEVFIYCIQGEKEKQTNPLAKRLDRHFRKANKNVDMTDEILSQVSVSALVSLTIFLAYQKTLGVKKVSAYNFMPLRYETAHNTQMLRLTDEEKKLEFEQMHDRNQFNITNKFFNTLIRYAHHFNIDFENDEVCEKLELSLGNSTEVGDNIIQDIEKAVLNGLESNIILTN